MNDNLNAVMTVLSDARCSNELVIADTHKDETVTLRCEVLQPAGTHYVHSAKIGRVELIWK